MVWVPPAVGASMVAVSLAPGGALAGWDVEASVQSPAAPQAPDRGPDQT